MKKNKIKITCSQWASLNELAIYLDDDEVQQKNVYSIMDSTKMDEENGGEIEITLVQFNAFDGTLCSLEDPELEDFMNNLPALTKEHLDKYGLTEDDVDNWNNIKDIPENVYQEVYAECTHIYTSMVDLGPLVREMYKAFDRFEDKYTGNPEFNSENEEGFEGRMETYSPHIDKVMEHMAKHPKTVWTVVDGEIESDPERTYIVAGFRRVNRVLYFISNEEWKNEDELYDYEGH